MIWPFNLFWRAANRSPYLDDLLNYDVAAELERRAAAARAERKEVAV